MKESDVVNRKIILSLLFLVVITVSLTTVTMAEDTVMLYSADGSVIEVYASEVKDYTSLGWHENIEDVQAIVYTPEGDECVVYLNEVEAYVALGWYKSPVVKMYSETGSSIVVDKSEVEIFKTVGWYENISDVQTTLYAPGGKSITVYNSEVELYLSLGWGTAPIGNSYYQGTYLLDYGVFAQKDCMYTSYENGDLTFLYAWSDEETFDNYVEWLKKDGWILYYEDDTFDAHTVYLVDRTNQIMIVVSESKTEPKSVSVVYSA